MTAVIPKETTGPTTDDRTRTGNLVIAPDPRARHEIATLITMAWRRRRQAGQDITIVTISPDGTLRRRLDEEPNSEPVTLLDLSDEHSPDNERNLLSGQEQTIRTATIRTLCRTMRETWPHWDGRVEDTMRRALEVAMERNRHAHREDGANMSLRDALEIARNLSYDDETDLALRSAARRLEQTAEKSPATGTNDRWPHTDALRAGQDTMIDGGLNRIGAEWSALVSNWLITATREWAIGQLWTARHSAKRHIHLIADQAEGISGAYWELLVGDNDPELISYTVCNTAPPPPARRGRSPQSLYDRVIAGPMSHAMAVHTAPLLDSPGMPVSPTTLRTLPEGYVVAREQGRAARIGPATDIIGIRS